MFDGESINLKCCFLKIGAQRVVGALCNKETASLSHGLGSYFLLAVLALTTHLYFAFKQLLTSSNTPRILYLYH